MTIVVEMIMRKALIYELMTIAKMIYEIRMATAFSVLPEKESQVCTHYA